MKNAIFIFFALVLFSCKKEELKEELAINYKGFDIYLKTPKGSDAPQPPILHLNFMIKNLSNHEKLFTSKGNSFDKTKSAMYILDTLQNKIIPLYSRTINSIEPNDSIKMKGDIDVNELKKYFGLSEDFFDKQDFTGDKENLTKLYLNMLNNSVIIYIPDSTDLRSYKIDDKNLTNFRNNSIIKITK
jgi:hypothetical protein